MSDQTVLPLVSSTPEVAYRSERVTLWLGDARAVLAGMPTESLDLVVTDPPYGESNVSGRRADTFGQIHNDTARERGLVAEVLEQSVRIVAQHRHLYVFGPADVLAGLKVSEVAELVWDKGTIGSGRLDSPWGPGHEPVSFAVSMHRHAGKAGNSASPVRRRKGSVLRFGRPTGRSVRHPNEKPVDLLRELIESSSRLGEVVLDPFAGSGSTGVAAVLAGRRAMLVESDARWIPLAVDRLRRADEVADLVRDASR